jgi:two-component system, NtrC family, nitrogen regulation response regulator NtrX
MSTLSTATAIDVRGETRASKLTPVLFLDCPIADRREVERQLAAANLAVIWVESSAAAIAELQRRDMPVLVDFSRGAASLQAVRDVRAQKPTALLFSVVDPRRPDLATEAVLAGSADVFAPPLDGARVARAVERERGYLAQDGDQQSAGSDELYCHSAPMREVKTRIAAAATTRSGVLVCGESGVGRSVVARAIHHAAASVRAGAFVTIDCAAYDGDCLGTELFGVAPRAEDNLAARGLERVSRQGLAFAAIGGTLYLQNVGEAPTRVQRRLARLLRDREAVLADTGEVIAFDVRCIVAGDARFETAVKDGTVQEDLYRRLAATRIEIPALRNRREDIPALANCFLREACAAAKVPAKSFSRSALSLLAALPWTGNATEMKALLKTIVGGLGARGIGVEDVLAHVRLGTGSVMVSHGGTLRQARAQFEQQYIAAILQQHRGRITQAAKALGIQRTNLYRKMRTLRVAQPGR